MDDYNLDEQCAGYGDAFAQLTSTLRREIAAGRPVYAVGG